MSYAGTASRRGTSTIARIRSSASTPPRGGRPGHEPSPEAAEAADIDWQQVAIFGIGLALGLAVGAGAALLFAPQSGSDTRRSIARAGRGVSRRTHDAWDDLRDELRRATRRGTRKISHSIEDRRQAAKLRRARRRARQLEMELADDE